VRPLGVEPTPAGSLPSGIRVQQLTTPCALVDHARVERNTTRMSERATALGVRLRPHVKTHKCVGVAALQVRGHFGGITVSTLAEARHFADAGYRDITYAVPIAPAKLQEAAAVAQRIDRLALLLDHPAALDAIEASVFGGVFAVYLKVDCGHGRAGVDPESAAAAQLARRLADSTSIDFRGLLTHAGHSYSCKNRREAAVVAAAERDLTVGFAERLRRGGVDVPEVSVGSTPTLCAVDHLNGVTEVRPGNYAFFDAFQATIGSCALDDVAFTVLATVIGNDPAQRKLVLDAGALALSKDRGATHLDPDCGYGVVLAADGATLLRGLHVTSLSQEHGVVRVAPTVDLERFPIGHHLRIVPNHSCLAAALFDRYHVVSHDQVINEWHPTRNW